MDVSKLCTKFHLAMALFARIEGMDYQTTITDSNGIRHDGKVVGIEMEDGSGKCWNVTIATSKGRKTVFVRTID